MEVIQFIHSFDSFAAERRNIEKARPDHQAPTEAPVQTRDRIPQTSKSNIVCEKPKKKKPFTFHAAVRRSQELEPRPCRGKPFKFFRARKTSECFRISCLPTLIDQIQQASIR